MPVIVVRYRVKAERSEENIRYIQGVFDALRAAAPEGVKYTAMRLEDGVSFVHLALIDTVDGSNPIAALDAFKAFVKDIGERCAEPPQAMQAEVIGDYEFNLS